MSKILKIESSQYDPKEAQQHNKCVKLVLKIIIDASKLSILGIIVNEHGNVKYSTQIHNLYQSVLENIEKSISEEYKCQTSSDFMDNEMIENIIDRIGNLDYDYAAELGTKILNFYSNILLNKYV